jgi:serine/threonine-protein kinase
VGTERPPRFDPVFLGRLTAALAREIGPVAKLIVRRAAERATDAPTLCEMLAENVPESSRTAFRAGLGDVGAAAPVPSPAVPEPAPAKASIPGREIGPALLARAEQLLTRQIGPLARVLVREAAKQTGTPRELFERLAVHIDDKGVRIAFIAEADRPV